MTSSRDLDPGRVLLLAAQSTTEGNLQVLHRLVLQHPDTLSPETIYRLLLTFCPHDISSQDLLRLLQSTNDAKHHQNASDSLVEATAVHHIDDREVRVRLRKLRLLELPKSPSAPDTDLISRFLLARAYQTDSSGDDLIPLVQTLVPFLEHSEPLRYWFISKLLPIVRLRYEYYPETNVELRIHDLDVLHGRRGVAKMLENGMAGQSTYLGRDLRGVVGPWIHGQQLSKKRKREPQMNQAEGKESPSWEDVNEWLLEASVEAPQAAETSIRDWNGPQDIDLGGFDNAMPDSADDANQMRYHQAALATIYAFQGMAKKDVMRAQATVRRISEVFGIDTKEVRRTRHSQSSGFFDHVSRSSLLQNSLLNPDNELTIPSKESLEFLRDLLTSQSLVAEFRSPMSIKEATTVCLFASKEQQMLELKRMLQNIAAVASAHTDWTAIRGQILWLRSWSNDVSAGLTRTEEKSKGALLWQLSPQMVDAEILRTMLEARAFAAAFGTYGSVKTSLSSAATEHIVVKTILEAYDNASNGNRTRGGMLRAQETLSTFEPMFPDSVEIQQIRRLITATHSLSFYHLTLQDGVPFLPVGIRLQKDPISLLRKVLEQNPKAYTKLDDLLSIGRNFVEAGLPLPEADISDSVQTKILLATHRITYLSINSALSSNDFDTAYSYIATRFSNEVSRLPEDFVDDTSWRAAYAAGTYDPPSTSFQSLQTQIQHLSRRMELLSQALMLAPKPDSLSEVLAAWQVCESRLEGLKSAEATQNFVFDRKASLASSKTSNRISLAGSSVLPGGFGSEIEDRERDVAETARMADSRRHGGLWSASATTGAASRQNSLASPTSAEYEQEGPLGLFDVARGAANAFQRSAIRWSAPVGPGTTRMPEPRRAATIDESGQRVRKRDQISNLVTGGLVSGMSWVLGAPPPAERNAPGYPEGGTAPDGEEE